MASASPASRSSFSLRRGLPPGGKRISSDMIGGLLIASGLIEAVAGSLRREVRPFAMAAGGVTALAGPAVPRQSRDPILPNGHAGDRLAAHPQRDPCDRQRRVRRLGADVDGLSAGMDFLLAALLIAGLSISTLVISIFGPTAELDRELRLGARRELRRSMGCCCSRSRAAPKRVEALNGRKSVWIARASVHRAPHVREPRRTCRSTPSPRSCGWRSRRCSC